MLTSTLANRFLGERVTPVQWLGLLLGLSGVVLVLHNRNFEGQSLIGWAASGVSLVGITIGTLYQKRFCSHIDWRAGNLIQFIAVTVFFALGALLFETRNVIWSPTFVLAIGWLVVVLSVGSIGLLYWLIRHSAATQVASLFYLVPGVTALMAFVLFDERLDALSILGMVVCAAGVVLVNRPALVNIKSRSISFPCTGLGISLPSSTRAPIHHALVQLPRAHLPGESSAPHALFKEGVI